MFNYTGFKSWQNLQLHASQGKPFFYKSPLDRFPVRVLLVKQYKNGKLRIKPVTTLSSFTVDEYHLSRFLRH